jgi:integrase
MRLLAEGVAMPEIAKRMGHKNLKMLIDHYLRWAPEKTEKKVRR